MIVAGFGFRASATSASLMDAYAQAVGAEVPTHLAAPHDKSDAAALRTVADHLQLPLLSIDDAGLRAAQTLTRSPAVLATRGVGSVAEGVALAAAGDGARLTGPRCISSDRLATCAIAIGAMP